MGCGVSRLDGNGMVLPPRLRPLFLHRLEEIKLRRHAPLKDSSSTPSKKELLFYDRDEDENASSSSKIVSKNMSFCPKDQVMKYHEDHKNDEKDHSKIIQDLKAKNETETETDSDNVDDDHDHDDDYEDDDGRMIGHDNDDRAFPGSPSFRVYFKDDGRDEHKDIGKINDASKKSAVPSDDNVTSKETSEKKKATKRGRKKKNFRKSAVKNLLSVKSCYNSPPSAHHHQSHLLTGKTTA